MQTADGVPYWKIALLHLDSIASTVVQKCIYWGTHEQCAFCGIELTRGGQTVPVKTPAMLAEVCTAARDLDGAVDVTLTTGSLNRRDRGALYIAKCATAIKEACGLPVQVQFEPPDDLTRPRRGPRGRRRRGRHPPRDLRPRGARARGAGQGGRPAIDGYFRAWERAVEVFGRGRVTTYVILGMGEDRALTEEGCRRAIEMGVYPFVVPLRPVPGTLMADAQPPAPDYVASVYRSVSAMLAEAGFDHADAGAGCARCQACSGLSAWERVFEKERWRELADRRALPSSPERPACGCAAASAERARPLRRAPRRVRRRAGDVRRRRSRRARRQDHDAARDRRSRAGAWRAPCGSTRWASGDWKGDRLAVLPEARHGALGARLVRFAVATAGSARGRRGWWR